jgi:hypothetical protein
MNQYEFVLVLVLIMMVAGVVKTVIKKPPRRAEGDNPEADRLRAEVGNLKDRIAVLERIATDKAGRLEREIEELRDR